MLPRPRHGDVEDPHRLRGLAGLADLGVGLPEPRAERAVGSLEGERGPPPLQQHRVRHGGDRAPGIGEDDEGPLEALGLVHGEDGDGVLRREGGLRLPHLPQAEAPHRRGELPEPAGPVGLEGPRLLPHLPEVGRRLPPVGAEQRGEGEAGPLEGPLHQLHEPPPGAEIAELPEDGAEGLRPPPPLRRQTVHAHGAVAEEEVAEAPLPPAALLGQREEGVVVEAGEGAPERGRQGQLPPRVVHALQQVGEIHDLPRLVEPPPADDLEGDVPIRQRPLHDLHVRRGAQQDRRVAPGQRPREGIPLPVPPRHRRFPALHQGPEAIRQEPRLHHAELPRRLAAAPLHEVEFDAGPGGDIEGGAGDEVLPGDLDGEAAGEGRTEHGIGEGEDPGAAAEVLPQQHRAPLAGGLPRAEEAAVVGAAEAVDRLLRVAHDEEPVRRAEEREQRLLHRVRVLELVHEEVVEAGPHLLPHPGVVAEEPEGPPLEVVEVERPPLVAGVGVGSVQFGDEGGQRPGHGGGADADEVVEEGLRGGAHGGEVLLGEPLHLEVHGLRHGGDGLGEVIGGPVEPAGRRGHGLRPPRAGLGVLPRPGGEGREGLPEERHPRPDVGDLRGSGEDGTYPPVEAAAAVEEDPHQLLQPPGPPGEAGEGVEPPRLLREDPLHHLLPGPLEEDRRLPLGQHREGGVHAGLDGVLLEQAGAEGVEGGDPGRGRVAAEVVAAPLPQRPGDPLPHLDGGAVREGEGEDPLHLHPSLEHEVDEALREDRGLPGAGAGDDAEVAVEEGDGVGAGEGKGGGEGKGHPLLHFSYRQRSAKSQAPAPQRSSSTGRAGISPRPRAPTAPASISSSRARSPSSPAASRTTAPSGATPPSAEAARRPVIARVPTSAISTPAGSRPRASRRASQ